MTSLKNDIALAVVTVFLAAFLAAPARADDTAPSTNTVPPTIAAPANPVAAPANLVASVPFQFVNNKVVVDAMINGKGPYSFAIDSGSETMIVSQAVAKVCKLPVNSANVDVSGPTGGSVGVGMAIVTHLGIGAAIIEHPVCTLSNGHISFDGYIGEPLFDNYVVQIDFGMHVVNLYKKDTYVPDPADIATSITFGKHRVPVIAGSIAGIPATFEVDTGSAFAVELLPTLVKADDLTDKFQKVGSVMSSTVNGPASNDIYGMKALSLGDGNPLNVDGDVQAIFLATANPMSDFSARIGAPTLSHGIVTFDYDKAKLYVRPIPPPPGISL